MRTESARAYPPCAGVARAWPGAFRLCLSFFHFPGLRELEPRCLQKVDRVASQRVERAFGLALASASQPTRWAYASPLATAAHRFLPSAQLRFLRQGRQLFDQSHQRFAEFVAPDDSEGMSQTE
jgi:hypothetical protein